MAEIKKIYNNAGEQIYGQTHERAVVDNNGTTAETKFQMITDLVQQAQMEIGAVPSDLTPTEGSTNWVTSGGVYDALQEQNAILGTNYCQVHLYNNSSKIAILRDGTDFSVTIPANTVIHWYGGYYKVATVTTFTFSLTVNNGIVYFNHDTKGFRGTNVESVCGENEHILFTVGKLGNCSLLSQQYTFNSVGNTLFKEKTVNANYTAGWYINNTGVKTENASWMHSDEISLSSGDILIMFFDGTGTAAAPISLVETDGQGNKTYTPIYKNSRNADVYYYYIPSQNCTVILSNRTSQKVSLFTYSENAQLNEMLKGGYDAYNIAQELKTYVNTETINPNYVAGWFINASTGAVTANDSWCHSDEIQLSDGDIICMEFYGTGTNAAPISIVTEEVIEGVTTKIYTPVCSDVRHGRFTHTYTAVGSQTVLLCNRYSVGYLVYKIKRSSVLTFLISGIDEAKTRLDNIERSLYTLPSAYSDKIEVVNTFKKDMFCFAIQTDTHYTISNTSNINSGNDVKELSKYIGFDFAANLGDIIQGYSDMTLDLYRTSMTEMMKRYIDGICCPFLYCKGNHENNGMYAATLQDPSEGYIYNDELYGRTMVQAKNTFNGNWHGNGKVLYGYVDFEEIRVICVNTNDGGANHFGFGISDEQLSWFTNVALNTTKKVIVLSHVPLINNLDPESTWNNNESIRQLLTPISNFIANGGDVIGCFCGHTHKDLQKLNDGVNHISFLNGSVVNVVCIDQVNRKIYIKSIGYSNDREFSY